MQNCGILRAVAVAFGLAAAGPAFAQGQEPIKLGVILPLSGQYGEYVRRYLLAPTEWTVKETNAAGGLNGRQIRLVIEDSRFDPASAVSALRKLADVDKVVAVFTGFTPLTLPQLPVAEEKKIIIIAPQTEHPDLTKSRWAVRMTPTADKAGLQIAAVAEKLGVKTVAILYENNESVRITERAFQGAFEKSGGKLIASESFRTQDTDMRGQLTKLRSANPEALYIITSAGRPMALALRQISEVGFKPKRIFANHLIEDREVKSIGGQMSEGVIYTTLDVDAEFAKRFQAALGYAPDANAGKQYDATLLLFEAIKRAKTGDDATKIRDAIYGFGEFKGTLGTFRFEGSGEPGINPLVKIVKDGSYIEFKP